MVSEVKITEGKFSFDLSQRNIAEPTTIRRVGLGGVGGGETWEVAAYFMDRNSGEEGMGFARPRILHGGILAH